MSRIAYLCFRVAFTVAAVLALPASTFAACTSPAGTEGEVIYNTDYATMQFCDNTNWISMAASGSSQTVSDPRIGALTNNNFCTSNAGGTQIVCATPSINLASQVSGNLPVANLGSGTGASATTFWRGDGTWATAGAAASGISGSVQFSNGSGLSSDATNFFWDNTNKRLGVGIATPGQSIDTAGNVKSAQHFFAPQTGWAAPATVSGGSVGTLTANAFCTANAAGTQVVCATAAIPISSISATGTASATTYLRGDGSWSAVSSSQWATNGANISYSAGNVGIGTTSPAAKLDVNGGIKLANDAATCTATNTGELRWTGSNLQICVTNGWYSIAVNYTITVTSATYGPNCSSPPTGNATSSLSTACNGLTSCNYVVSVGTLGDPCGGVSKTFTADYTCGSTSKTVNLSGEANGKTATLTCP